MSIGIPVAIIGAAGAMPFMVMASKSSAFSAMTSSIGKGFAVNSGRQMGINAGMEFGSQYLSNGIVNNDWGLSNIDAVDIASKGIFGNVGGLAIGAEFDLNYNEGFKANSLAKFSENMVVGGLKYKATKTFSGSTGKLLGKMAPSFGGMANIGGQFTIRTTIESSMEKLKRNLKD